MEEDAAMQFYLSMYNFANLVIKEWHFLLKKQVLGLSSETFSIRKFCVELVLRRLLG